MASSSSASQQGWSAQELFFGHFCLLLSTFFMDANPCLWLLWFQIHFSNPGSTKFETIQVWLGLRISLDSVLLVLRLRKSQTTQNKTIILWQNCSSYFIHYLGSQCPTALSATVSIVTKTWTELKCTFIDSDFFIFFSNYSYHILTSLPPALSLQST